MKLCAFADEASANLSGQIEALRRTIDDHSDAVSLAAKRRADAEQVIAKLTEDRLALEGRKTRTERDIQNRSSEILNQERLRASLEQKRNELLLKFLKHPH